MNEIILQNKDGQVLVSSRDIAEKFGKQHSSVLKTIYGENRKGNHVEGLSDEILASGNPLTKYFIESYLILSYVKYLNMEQFILKDIFGRH